MSGWLIPNIQIRYVMKYPIQFPSHRWSPLYGCSAFCQLPHGLFSQRCFNNIVFFSRVFPWYLEQNKLLLCTIQSFFDSFHQGASTISTGTFISFLNLHFFLPPPIIFVKHNGALLLFIYCRLSKLSFDISWQREDKVLKKI